MQTTKACIMDIDGVIWRGNNVIPGAAEAVNKIKNLGYRPYFVTNNSLLSKEQIFNKLNYFGIEHSFTDIFSAPNTAASYISSISQHASTYVIGSQGLKEEIEKAGLVKVRNPEKAQFVVVGNDKNINYKKLHLALKALMGGAKFIAVNDDKILPQDEGYVPGAGAIIGALKGMLDRDPDVLIGKPNPFFIQQELKKANICVNESVMVGDSLSTDILLAKKLSIPSILVFTENRSAYEDFSDDRLIPDFTINSIAELPSCLSQSFNCESSFINNRSLLL